jgi:hypothetical protein
MTTSLIIFTAFTTFALLLFNAIVVYRVWTIVEYIADRVRFLKGTAAYLQPIVEDTNKRTIEIQQGVTHPCDDLLVDKLKRVIANEMRSGGAIRDK